MRHVGSDGVDLHHPCVHFQRHLESGNGSHRRVGVVYTHGRRRYYFIPYNDEGILCLRFGLLCRQEIVLKIGVLFFCGLQLTSSSTLSIGFLALLEGVIFVPKCWPWLLALQEGYRQVFREGPLRWVSLTRIFRSDEVKAQKETTGEKTRDLEEPLRTASASQFSSLDTTNIANGSVFLERIRAHEASSTAKKLYYGCVKILGTLREALLFPVVAGALLLDPYLRRFVDRAPRGPAHYRIILHGSGANSGQWLLGRCAMTAKGFGDYCLWPNYLGGFSHTGARGGVDFLADTIIPQIEEELAELATGLVGSPRKIEISLVGHSLGGLLVAEMIHRWFFCAEKPTKAFSMSEGGSVQIRDVVCLSAPFRGAPILSFLKRWVPFSEKLDFFNTQPHVDFFPRSRKVQELSSNVRKELLAGRAVPKHVGRILVVAGGTDWIVPPRSAFCVENGEDRSDETAKMVYLEGLGHYSLVAVGWFWDLLTDILR